MKRTHQIRWSSQCMRFARPCLTVTKGRTAKALNRHFDNSLNARVLQNVVLRGARLEHHIVAEQFGFLAATARTARNSVALYGLNKKKWCLKI